MNAIYPANTSLEIWKTLRSVFSVLTSTPSISLDLRPLLVRSHHSLSPDVHAAWELWSRFHSYVLLLRDFHNENHFSHCDSCSKLVSTSDAMSSWAILAVLVSCGLGIWISSWALIDWSNMMELSSWWLILSSDLIFHSFQRLWGRRTLKNDLPWLTLWLNPWNGRPIHGELHVLSGSLFHS